MSLSGERGTLSVTRFVQQSRPACQKNVALEVKEGIVPILTKKF